MAAKKRVSSPSGPDIEAIKSFKELFFAARKAHLKTRRQAVREDPAHQAAISFARLHSWAWAEVLLEALFLVYQENNQQCLDVLDEVEVPSAFIGERYLVQGFAYYGLKNWDSALERYCKALESQGFDTPAMVWNNMGLAHAGKKEFDEALACYRKALESTGYDTPGKAWNNMGLAHVGKKEFDEAFDCYRKALESPGYDTPGGAWNNMGLAHAGKKEFDKALECYRKAFESQGFGTPGGAWSNMGLAHAGKKQFDEALECYRKALESQGFDTPGGVWNNMGIAHVGKKEFDEALKYFRKVLESPGYDTPGDAWNNMGGAHAGKKEFDEALDCYRKALESPGYDTPGKAWSNMGIAYGEKKEYDAALECYRKALESPGYDTPHTARLNCAMDLRDSGRPDEAKLEIERVLSESDKEGQHARARLLLSTIKSSERGFAPDPDEEALTAPAPPSLDEGPEGRMKQALMDRRSRYEEYLSEKRDSAPDGLSILRGWSSSVTLLEGAQDCQWSGGGYFLKWRGKGLVIDPGFDFLDNFHQAGFHATDIHAVVVSHNHPDHNADLNTLDNLCYEIARVADPMPKFLFAMDEDTAAQFVDNSPKHRGSPHKFTRSDHERNRWLDEEDLPFSIEHFPVKHGRDVPHANGLRFRLRSADGGNALIIGYTGDGEYTEDLSEQLQGVDLLIAHVSQPDAKEFNDSSHLKKTHLGYNGAIRLIKEVRPKLTLIGEFWAGLADLRLDLIAGIRLRSGVDTVLPACLGLHLNLPDLKIPCSRCRQLVPPEQIRIAPPLNEFGLLGYLCNRCIL